MNLDRAIDFLSEEINIGNIKGTIGSVGKSKREIIKWVFDNKYRDTSKDSMVDTFQKFINRHKISIKEVELKHKHFAKKKTAYIVKVDSKEYKIKETDGDLNELR